jgi:hypothetical protein
MLSTGHSKPPASPPNRSHRVNEVVTDSRWLSHATVRLFTFATVLLALFSESGSPLVGYVSEVWSDACPCTIPCTCWRTHRSSAEMCANFPVFKVLQGRYRGRELGGSVFVLLNLPSSPHRAPVANTLYIDSAVDEETASAIISLIGSIFAPLHEARIHIQFVEGAKTQALIIPGLLEYKVNFTGDYNVSDEVLNYLYPWLADPRQGTVEQVAFYRSNNNVVQYSGTNAILARFRISTQ